MTETLYFRQLLSGRDHAGDNQIAHQMVNFSYLIGDRRTGEALVVDPAYDAAGLVDLAAADGMTITGVLATHYHADHVGGSMMGFSLEGAAELLDLVDVPVHIQAPEAEFLRKTTGIGDDSLEVHASGDIVSVGSIDVELIHTPGHTPGSQCFMVEGCLVAGDTLFLDGCGRTDLPGGDPSELYRSLTQRLARVPDSAILYPGHQYSALPSQEMGQTRRNNVVFRPESAEDWLRMFGH